MFDIGFWELIVIAIVALLVIGPDRLPGFAREAGRSISKLRRIINNTRRELERELKLNEQTGLGQQLSELDDLMRGAPDQDPDYAVRLQKKNKETDTNTGT